MSETIKTPSSHRDIIKKEIQERKRNILHLICHYLRNCNLHVTADCLTEEAQLQENLIVCDNVDLDVILQEYQSYYQVKFQKTPKFVRKLDNCEISPAKTKVTTAKKKVTATKIKNKKETVEDDEFQFEIISLGCNQTKESGDGGFVAKTRPLCEYENYTVEWREIADQITKEVIPKNLGITWNDCVGLENAIVTIKESIILPCTHPELFHGILTPFKGILLYGPPGTGKTLLAKALACEQPLPVFNVTCSSYVSKWRGESEKLLKTLFDVAKLYAPSIIFIDEVDAFVSTTNEHQQQQHEASIRFKGELLTHLDGICNGDERIFVFAITNSPWRLDSALLRRFERRVLIDVPNSMGRIEIFKYYFAKSGYKFGQNDLMKMAEMTENYSGCEIKILCKEVGMGLVREVLGMKGDVKIGQMRQPGLNDVIKAVGKVKSSLNEGLLKKYREWNEKFGCL